MSMEWVYQSVTLQEEKMKEQRRERRRERKKRGREPAGEEVEEEEEVVVDPEMAAVMGFSGFGATKRKAT